MSMLITKHFAFVHVPKTGGTFLYDLCREHLPGDWLIENELTQHSPYRALRREVARGALPAAVADLPVIAFVRNPWDWYVSWYHHEMVQPPDRSRWWLDRYDFASQDFKQIVTKACTESSGEQMQMRLMRRERMDFYSAGFALLVKEGVPDGAIEVGRFENLRDDFLAFLGRHGVPVDGAFEEAVRSSVPVNVSARSDYRGYYDDELRELVADRASDLIAEYGYTF